MPDAITESQRLLAQLRFPCGEVPEPGMASLFVLGGGILGWARRRG